MADMTLSRPVTNIRAILAFSIGCLLFTYAFVQRVAPSVMVGDLMDAFDVSAAALGGLGAWYFYAYASIQMPVGILMDRFGPRPLFALTMLLSMGGSLLFGMAESLEIAALGRFIIGGSVAFAYVGSVSIATRLFPASNLPIAIGMLQLIGMMGAVLGQAPLATLISYLGWRESMVVFAIAALVLAILSFFIVPTMPRIIHENGKKGSLKTLIMNRHTWFSAFIGFACAAPMLSFAALWAVPWLQDIHLLSLNQAATTASMAFAGWGIGSALAGGIFKRVQNRKALLLGSMALIFIIMAFLLASDSYLGLKLPQSILTALFFTMGFVNGTMIISFIFVREANAPENSGAALGAVNMFVVGSGAVMQPLIGYLLDIQWLGTVDENGRRLFDSQAYSSGIGSLLIVIFIGMVCATLVQDKKQH